MKQLQLGSSLAREIVKPTFDLGEDYADISIDAITTNPLIRQIPIAKTAAAIFRTGMAVRERHFAKKSLMFLNEFHAGLTDNEKNREFRDRLNSDPAFAEKVVDHLLVVLDRYVTSEKAQIRAHLFRAHTNGEIGWDDFVSLTVVLEPVINFAPVNPMESAQLSQSDRDSEGNRECIPCHISRTTRFTRVLNIRATRAAPQSS